MLLQVLRILIIICIIFREQNFNSSLSTIAVLVSFTYSKHKQVYYIKYIKCVMQSIILCL